MKPSSRKPLGILLLIAGLIVYAGVVARLVAPLGRLPWFAAVPAYALLGCLWLLPMGPWLRWMATGLWRTRR